MTTTTAAWCRPKNSRTFTRTEVAVLVVVAAVLVLAAGLPALRTIRTERVETVRVEAGDTLWSIASAHPVTGAATAVTVAEIRRMNGLSSSNVAAGSILRVPGAGSNAAAWASR